MANGLIFLGGLVAVGGVTWYLYSAGYFNSIIDAINKAIEGPVLSDPGTNPCSGGKIPCKDGKCNTQEKCDTQAKCKSGQHWSPVTKKCASVPESNLALINVANSGQHRAYRVYYQ